MSRAFIDNFEPSFSGLSNVRERFRKRLALRNTTRQRRNFRPEATFFSGMNDNSKFHIQGSIVHDHNNERHGLYHRDRKQFRGVLNEYHFAFERHVATGHTSIDRQCGGGSTPRHDIQQRQRHRDTRATKEGSAIKLHGKFLVELGIGLGA